MFSCTYHLKLPIIFSKVLSPLQTVTSQRQNPSFLCSKNLQLNSKKSLEKWGWLCFVESTPRSICLLARLFVYMLRKAGSNPLVFSWWNRLLWNVLALNRPASLQAGDDKLQSGPGAKPTASPGPTGKWEAFCSVREQVLWAGYVPTHVSRR